MNTPTDLIKLVKISKVLEKQGLYREADSLSKILTKLALNEEVKSPEEATEPEVATEQEVEPMSMDVETQKALADYQDFENFAKEILPSEINESTSFYDLAKMTPENLSKLKELAKKVDTTNLSSEHQRQITESINSIDELLRMTQSFKKTETQQ